MAAINIRALMGALLRDRRGVTSLYVTFCLTVMVLLMLAGTDMVRIYMIKSRAQAAIDAAVLAAGHSLGSSDCKTQGDAYFAANLGDNYLGSSITSPLTFVVDGTGVTNANAATTCNVSSATGDLVTASATVSVPLLTVGFISLGAVTLTVSNQAQRTTSSNLELVLALDNTGSMADDNKLTALQSSAKSLINSLFGSKSTGASIYVGLVPFVETVRAGKDSVGTVHGGWLTGGKPSHFASTSSWGGCFFERRDGGGDFTLDAAPPTSLGFSDWAVSHYDWIDTQTCTFHQCYSSASNWLAGQPPPTTENCNPSQYPQSVGGERCSTSVPAYNYESGPGTSSNSWSSGYYGCMQTPVTFLSSNQGALTSAVNAMVANGSTMISSGVLWAWRMLAPAWRNADPNSGWGSATLPQDTSNTLTKAIVLLTDGNNAPSYLAGNSTQYGSSTQSGWTTTTRYLYPYYLLGPYQGTPQKSAGAATNGRPGYNILFNIPTADSTYTLYVAPGGDPDDHAAADAILAAACSNAKASGITIFTIALDTDGSVSSNTRNLLSNCASKPSYYYTVTQSSGLAGVFASITGKLSELKLVK